MVDHYHGTRPKTEMLVDYLLYGALQGEFGKFTRQYKVKIGTSTRSKRVDFRQGGSRPVGIEFAVRTQGRNEIYGSQNRSEINKLTRLKKSRWSTRILLLLDLAKKPLSESALRATYAVVKSGKGRFIRHPVSVVYVHKESSFRFIWNH